MMFLSREQIMQIPMDREYLVKAFYTE